jgi:hypothetical protein
MMMRKGTGGQQQKKKKDSSGKRSLPIEDVRRGQIQRDCVCNSQQIWQSNIERKRGEEKEGRMKENK